MADDFNGRGAQQLVSHLCLRFTIYAAVWQVGQASRLSPSLQISLTDWRKFVAAALHLKTEGYEF
jgi:hypothetical protein